MMHGYGTGLGSWGFALLAITFLLLGGLLIAGLVALVRTAGHSRPQAAEPAGSPPLPTPPRPPQPDQVLAARFARGEIGEDEYQRRLAVLRGTSPGTRPGHQPASQ
jgi:putative membrane protein